VLEEMAEIGLDVINPIQPLAMEPGAIKRKYGHKLTLFGGMDVQRILPMGSPEEVKKEVRRLKQECGAGGGYILAPAHHIQSDTPLENVFAYYEAALEEVESADQDVRAFD
jgi:uroporphyrinogen decarboxylase